MRCDRCGKNVAKYEVEYFTRLRKGKEELCEACYRAAGLGTEDKIRIRPLTVRVCPFCGGGEEDYLRTGLVGCAECYRVFREELTPSVARMQTDLCHRGKAPVGDEEKYEAVLELEEMIVQQGRAKAEGDGQRERELSVKIAEWKAALFGNGEV